MIAMGIDVGGTNLRVGAVNSAGEIILSFREPTPQSTSPEVLVERISVLFTQVQKEISTTSSASLKGLGLGWPGAVDQASGTVLQTPNIAGFGDFPLQTELEKHLKLPCKIENDAKCAGLAEKKFGAAKNLKDFILLTFGTGIGGVIFTNDQMVRGRSGSAGELGHLCLHPEGLVCSCGSRGCFEQYASAKALERRGHDRLKKQLSAREILTLAATDPEAKSCVDEYTDDLALALGSLINIFNPEALVFSGGLFTTGGQIILDALKVRLAKQGFQTLKKDVGLLASTLEGKAGIVGAASLMF
jgi:glucokinase